MDQKAVDSAVQQAKNNNQVNMTLEEQCEDYLQVKDDLKEKSAQMRDMRENNVKWAELQDLQKKVKEIRSEIQGDPDFISLKEEIDELKEKRLVIESMIVSLLKEKKVSSYDYSNADFNIIEKFNYKKKVGDDENSKKYAGFVKDFDKSDMPPKE